MTLSYFMDELNFSRNIRLRQFERAIVLQLHAKFRKDPMTGFREKLRTDERTDMGQSIGPTSRVGGSKNKKGYLDKVAYKKVGIEFSYVSEN
jgi:hypothetical protein